jgi:hypothetical protein
MQRQEEAFASADQSQTRADELRNELEAAAFSLKSALDRDLPEFFADDRKERGLCIVESVQEWLAEVEGIRITPHEYESRLAAIHRILDPAIQCKNASREISEKAPRLIEIAEQSVRKCETVSNRPEAARARNGLLRAIADLRKFADLPKWELPKPSIESIEKYVLQIQSWVAQNIH